MKNRKLYRTFQSSFVHRTASVTKMGRELSVHGSEFHRVGPEYEQLRCP